MKIILPALSLLFLSAATVLEAESPMPDNDRYRDALQLIRQGDLPRIKTLLTDQSVLALRDDTGTPLAMYAALYLNEEGLELFLKHPTDPNVTNNAGASALLWAATDLAKVCCLLRHGAKATLASASGNTPLIVAALRYGSAPVLRELLANGADINASNDDGLNALTAAARVGDLDAVRLLIQQKANVNPASKPRPNVRERGNPLMNAALHGHLDIIKLLVESGADVNAMSDRGSALSWAAFADRRDCAEFLLQRGAKADQPGIALRSFRSDAGYTPLMYAAMTEINDATLVEALLARGVNVNAKSTEGETALDIAKKRGNTQVVTALLRAGAKDGNGQSTAADTKPFWSKERLEPSNPTMIRKSVEAALALQLESGARFTDETSNRCFSCHNQSLPALAVRMARNRGFTLDNAKADQELKDTVAAAAHRGTQNFESDFENPLIPSWLLLGLDAVRYQPDLLTDHFAIALGRTQSRDGQWLIGVARPPSSYSDVTTTAIALRALQLYAPPTMREEFGDRIKRAAHWLSACTPKSTEERTSQLLGLHWTNSSSAQIKTLAKALLQEQRSDGGWSQLSTLSSDAYATGQSLYALHLAGGLSANDASFQRGIRFLLQTQRDDGSWFVPTRAFPLQREIGDVFPHGDDQWSSILGTAWASLALMCGVPPNGEPSTVTLDRAQQ